MIGPQFTGLQHVNDMSSRNSPIADHLFLRHFFDLLTMVLKTKLTELQVNRFLNIENSSIF